jgi:hypothetical protein
MKKKRLSFNEEYMELLQQHLLNEKNLVIEHMKQLKFHQEVVVMLQKAIENEKAYRKVEAK